jgi:hypothetical protein
MNSIYNKSVSRRVIRDKDLSISSSQIVLKNFNTIQRKRYEKDILEYELKLHNKRLKALLLECKVLLP